MRERDFQVVFRNNNKMTGAFELKIVKGTSIPTNSVSEHQVDSLYNIFHRRGLFYKIPDPPIFKMAKTRFNIPRPFDCFYLNGIPAYIVLGWYFPRSHWDVCYIHVTTFIKYKEQSQRKSLTLDIAKGISNNFEKWKVGK